LANHPIPKLQVRTAYDPRSRSPPGFQTEEVAEEIKMWKNFKIGFAEMDEDKDMKNGIWAQIAKTNPIIVNQPTEEQMDRNTKSAIEIIFKTTNSSLRGVGKHSPRVRHHPAGTLSGSTLCTTN
jgi:hypothetical protein